MPENKTNKYDVIIIGGGITGAGIFLDAQSRGLKCCLIEKKDFAAGTSSKSTKLIHGGLRYLKELDFVLVAETGRERKIVHRIASHITSAERLLLPITRKGSLGKWTTRLAVRVYELLSGVEKTNKHRVLNTRGVQELIPSINDTDLLGAVEYAEYRSDDARLTIELIKKAVEFGGAAFNYTACTGILKDSEKAIGIECYHSDKKTSSTIFADYLINACGPWTDEILALDQLNADKKMVLSKGIHIVVDQKHFGLKQPVYFDTDDKRMLFAIPRDGKTYIGTTDTLHKEEPKELPILKDEVDYLLKNINNTFTGIHLKPEHIESSWAGLRPLVKKGDISSTSAISRKDELFISKSGIITITGGKLTGYRTMAKKTVDLICKKSSQKNRNLPPCNTASILLPGAYPTTKKEFIDSISEFGYSSLELEPFLRLFGKETKAILNLAVIAPNNILLPKLWWATLKYTHDHEFVKTPSDFFVRRTALLYFDIAFVKKHSREVANIIGEWQALTNDEIEKQYQDLIEEIKRATTFI